MSVENLKNISPFYQPRCMVEGKGSSGGKGGKGSRGSRGRNAAKISL
jgi:hypothetical protein